MLNLFKALKSEAVFVVIKGYCKCVLVASALIQTDKIKGGI